MKNANGVEIGRELSAARAAKKAYLKLVLFSELDRDECIAQLSAEFDADIVELAVEAVDSQLAELN